MAEDVASLCLRNREPAHNTGIQLNGVLDERSRKVQQAEAHLSLILVHVGVSQRSRAPVVDEESPARLPTIKFA